MYLFYRIFLFISGLSLLLALIASCDLCNHIRELRAFGGAAAGARRGSSGAADNLEN